LPSMVKFAAMTDSPPSEEVLGVGRRDETAKAGSAALLRSGAARSWGGGADGGTTGPAVAGIAFSFQSAMGKYSTVR
jgi:hypothetical protein